MRFLSFQWEVKLIILESFHPCLPLPPLSSFSSFCYITRVCLSETWCFKSGKRVQLTVTQWVSLNCCTMESHFLDVGTLSISLHKNISDRGLPSCLKPTSDRSDILLSLIVPCSWRSSQKCVELLKLCLFTASQTVRSRSSDVWSSVWQTLDEHLGVSPVACYW